MKESGDVSAAGGTGEGMKVLSLGGGRRTRLVDGVVLAAQIVGEGVDVELSQEAPQRDHPRPRHPRLLGAAAGQQQAEGGGEGGGDDGQHREEVEDVGREHLLELLLGRRKEEMGRVEGRRGEEGRELDGRETQGDRCCSQGKASAPDEGWGLWAFVGSGAR